MVTETLLLRKLAAGVKSVVGLNKDKFNKLVTSCKSQNYQFRQGGRKKQNSRRNA
jgi:hypothetical protein